MQSTLLGILDILHIQGCGWRVVAVVVIAVVVIAVVVSIVTVCHFPS
jgi:hypothetical protein